MTRRVSISLLIAYAVILAVDTFAFLVIFSIFIGDKGVPPLKSFSEWFMKIMIPVGGVGLLTLWVGLVTVLLLGKNIAGIARVTLFSGLGLGVLADITFFYGSATIGYGYVGMDMLGWSFIAVLYGCPIVIALHIIVLITRKGQSDRLPDTPSWMQ